MLVALAAPLSKAAPSDSARLPAAAQRRWTAESRTKAKHKRLKLVGNNHEGSIPFTRSIDYQGFSEQCNKSAVKQSSLDLDAVPLILPFVRGWECPHQTVFVERTNQILSFSEK
jgi:hypothetical protein